MAFDLTAARKTARNILEEFPRTANFSGNDFLCNKTILTKELQNRTRDWVENYNFSLIYILADISPAPVRGGTVIFEGITFRIMDVDEAPDDVTARIHLEQRYSSG